MSRLCFSILLHEANKWKKKRGLAVLCIQEHNLRAREEQAYKDRARAAGYSIARALPCLIQMGTLLDAEPPLRLVHVVRY